MFLFNRWISLYYIINLLTIRLDVFFVAGLLDANSLGLYSGASKIATLVILVANAYLTVLLVEMSSTPTAESLRTRTKSAVGTVLLFSAGIIILALLAQPVVQLLYGEQFAAAGRILQIMCVGLVFTVLAYPINASLYAANRSAVFPVMAAVAALGLVGGNIYLIPRYGAEGAAMAFSGSGFLAWSVLAIYYFIGTRSLHGKEILSPGMSDRGLRGVK
jgi:O-antigen/teichoic acid export membrane protein